MNKHIVKTKHTCENCVNNLNYDGGGGCSSLGPLLCVDLAVRAGSSPWQGTWGVSLEAVRGPEMAWCSVESNPDCLRARTLPPGCARLTELKSQLSMELN